MSPIETRLAEARARLNSALRAGADTRPFRTAIAAIEAQMARDTEAASRAAMARAAMHEQAVVHRAAQIANRALQAAAQLPGGAK